MAVKQAERELVTMANSYNWWIHKWSDVRICTNKVKCEECGHEQICKGRIFMTDRDQQDLDETIVDYLAFFQHYPVWIEVKGKPGKTRIPFTDLTEKQNDFLTSFYGRGVASFVFVTLGTQIPDRYAWLISIQVWNQFVEQAFSEGMKSFPYKPTSRKADIYSMEVFQQWTLDWKPNQGWRLPKTHPIRIHLPWVTNCPPLKKN